MKPPGTLKEVQRLVGSINFLRQFIVDYSRVTEPITRLLSKEKSGIGWGEEQDKAWIEIIKRLDDHLVLEHASQEGSFVLRTDA
ncbi:uncharacterized protein K02A2.6-like, partial [Aduncisulcus paluster]